MATKTWHGHVGFGLLSIPIGLCVGARDKRQISFNNLHKVCHTQLKMPKYCSSCDRQVPADEVVKGYEGPKGWIVVTEDEIDAIAPESEKFIEIRETVKWAEVDPLYLAESFYVVPEPAGIKAYSLLTKALTDTKSVAIGQLSKSNREHVVLFRPKGNGLIMHFVWYDNEIAKVPEFDNLKPAALSTNEITLAKQLVESLESDFKPGEFENGFEQRLITLIASKEPNSMVKAPEPVKQRPTKTADDIMEVLAASLATGKKKRAITLESKPAAKGKKGKAA